MYTPSPGLVNHLLLVLRQRWYVGTAAHLVIERTAAPNRDRVLTVLDAVLGTSRLGLVRSVDSVRETPVGVIERP